MVDDVGTLVIQARPAASSMTCLILERKYFVAVLRACITAQTKDVAGTHDILDLHMEDSNSSLLTGAKFWQQQKKDYIILLMVVDVGIKNKKKTIRKLVYDDPLTIVTIISEQKGPSVTSLFNRKAINPSILPPEPIGYIKTNF